MDQHEERKNPKFVGGEGEGFLNLFFYINKNTNYEKIMKGKV
jgi:hypothetical protein